MSRKRFGALLLAGTMVFANAAYADEMPSLDPAAVTSEADAGSGSTAGGSESAEAGSVAAEKAAAAENSSAAAAAENSSAAAAAEDSSAAAAEEAEMENEAGDAAAESGASGLIVDDESAVVDSQDTGSDEIQDGIAAEDVEDGIAAEDVEDGGEIDAGEAEEGEESALIDDQTDPEEDDHEAFHEKTVSEDLSGGDDALMKYLESFTPRKNEKKQTPRRNLPGYLNYYEKLAYDSLLNCFRSAANGSTNYAVFSIAIPAGSFDSTDFYKVYVSLRVDHPELFFWVGRSAYNPIQGTGGTSIQLPVDVAQDYQLYPGYTDDAHAYYLDTSKVSAINTAAANAAYIINAFREQNRSDYNKLYGYMYSVCDLNTYNDDAADNGEAYDPYENPWQIVYVFDGDPDTNVVCEGYAKAIKYLCDNTPDFQDRDLCAYTVSGNVYNNRWYRDAGPHMWNVIHTSDGNYLLDATWCDTDDGGVCSDQQFMRGVTYNFLGDYYLTWSDGEYTKDNYEPVSGGTAMYQYDDLTKALYTASELHVSEHEWGEDHTWDTGYAVDYQPTCGEPGQQSIHCTKCGAIKPGSQQAIPATGQHSFGAYQPVAPATFTSEGISVATCSVCGAQLTQHTPKLSTPSFEDSLVPLRVRQKSPVIPVNGLAAGDRITRVVSSNPRLVSPTVVGNGIRLKGGRKKKGKATITVYLANGASASMVVKVQKKKVRTRKIYTACARTLTLYRGQKVAIGAVKKPVTSVDKLSYKSTKKRVASVKGGVITAKKKGKTTIIVKSGRKKVKIKVRVI